MPVRPLGTSTRFAALAGLILLLALANHPPVFGRGAESAPAQARPNPQAIPATPAQTVDPNLFQRIPRIPDLRGRTVNEAARILAEIRVGVGTVREQIVGNARPGTIVDQNPAPGAPAAAGTAVDLLVAAQEQPSVVPDLTGRPLEQALPLIERAGLAPGAIVPRASGQPAGLVIEQSLIPGARVARGTAIDLAVAQAPAGTPTPNVGVEFVAVPDVTGVPLETAFTRLSQNGLNRGEIVRRPSPARAGTVIEQSVAPNTRVPYGTAVSLAIADTELVAMPELRGVDRQRAIDALLERRLVPRNVSGRPSPEPEDTVIAQSIAARTMVPVGAAVDLIVAQPELVLVPDLVGFSLDAALDTLARADLNAGSVLREQSAEPENQVLEQRPGPGARVRAGTRIDLAVAEPLRVEVPDVTGLALDEARRVLERAGLGSGRVLGEPSNRPVDDVIRQEPAGGAVVDAGTRVELVVSQVELVAVPALVGRTRESALDVLERARLSAGVVGDAVSDRPEGEVLSQSRAPGTEVPVHSTIDFTLARIERAGVPGVVGLPLDDAAAMLDDAGLTTGVVTRTVSPNPAGQVLSQSLPAGTLVPVATLIDLDVAEQQTVTVPPLGGMTLAQAQAALADAGLQIGTIGIEPATEGDGLILDQTVAAGSTVAIGTPVGIVIADEIAGETGIEVPPVVGLDEDEAATRLRVAGFQVGAVAGRGSDRPAGEVLSQTPEAGTILSANATVGIVVAQEDFVVPDLVGMAQAGAATLLQQAGFPAGPVTTSFRWFEPAGTVLSQTPSGGAVLGTPAPVAVVIATSLPVWAWAGLPLLGMLAAGGLMLLGRKPAPEPTNPRGRPRSDMPPVVIRARARPDRRPADARVRSGEPAGFALTVRARPDAGIQTLRAL
jgi:beta-lactam-binding protein with PASTA domain